MTRRDYLNSTLLASGSLLLGGFSLVKNQLPRYRVRRPLRKPVRRPLAVPVRTS